MNEQVKEATNQQIRSQSLWYFLRQVMMSMVALCTNTDSDLAFVSVQGQTMV